MAILANRIRELPPYLFSRLNARKRDLEAKGIRVIDLGIGSPVLPPPKSLLEKLREELGKTGVHQYPPYQGTRVFREAVARFYRNRYGVDLDPEREILVLIGSKEGIVHFLQAVLNPGDIAMLPDPGYPVYEAGVYLAGGKPETFPLKEELSFMPDFGAIPERNLEQTKVLFLNFPSNPTAAMAPIEVFTDTVRLAKKHRFLIAHDLAYGLVTFGGREAPSILQVPGAKDVAIEFGSLSKSFNIAGWRVGYAVGNESAIRALATVKSNTDTGQFSPLQAAGAFALDHWEEMVPENNEKLKKRMERLYAIFSRFGLKMKKPESTIFLWGRIPDGKNSLVFCDDLLEKSGILVTPGTAFGSRGEGYVRISFAVQMEDIDCVERRLLDL